MLHDLTSQIFNDFKPPKTIFSKVQIIHFFKHHKNIVSIQMLTINISGSLKTKSNTDTSTVTLHPFLSHQYECEYSHVAPFHFSLEQPEKKKTFNFKT